MKLFMMMTALIIGLATTAQAQVGKGLFAGGSLGFTMGGTNYQNGSNTTKGPTSSSFNVTPRIGYYFTDNIAAGIQFGFAGTSGKINGIVVTKTSSNTLSVGLFGRYALPLGDEGKFAFTGDLNLGFSATNGKSETGSLSVKSDPISQISVGIAPGILFFPTPKIGLEAGLGNILALTATTETEANNNDNKIKSTQIQIFNISTLGFYFGLNYYFNR